MNKKEQENSKLRKKEFAIIVSKIECLKEKQKKIYEYGPRNLYRVTDLDLFNTKVNEIEKLIEKFMEKYGGIRPKKFNIPHIMEADEVVLYTEGNFRKKYYNLDTLLEFIESKTKPIEMFEPELLMDIVGENYDKLIHLKENLDYRGKLRVNEEEIERITIRRIGTYFLNTPKFSKFDSPRKQRNDVGATVLENNPKYNIEKSNALNENYGAICGGEFFVIDK